MNLAKAEIYEALSKNEYLMIPTGKSISKAHHMAKSAKYSIKSKEFKEKADRYYSRVNDLLEKARSINSKSYLSYDVTTETYYLSTPDNNGGFDRFKIV